MNTYNRDIQFFVNTFEISWDSENMIRPQHKVFALSSLCKDKALKWNLASLNDKKNL
jgi:hypothetical protein